MKIAKQKLLISIILACTIAVGAMCSLLAVLKIKNTRSTLPLNPSAAVTSAGTFANGTYGADGLGTASDPFQIATAGQLVYFADLVKQGYNFYNQYVKLTSDINFWADGGYGRFSGIGINTWGTGTHSYPFCGTFDGDNHIVSKFFIYAIESSGTYDVIEWYTGHIGIGFFGSMSVYNGITSTIKNLRLKDFEIWIQSDRANSIDPTNRTVSVGGVVGHIGVSNVSDRTGTAEVKNCAVENMRVVQMDDEIEYLDIGGLVGVANYEELADVNITVNNCYVDGLSAVSNSGSKDLTFQYGGDWIGVFIGRCWSESNLNNCVAVNIASNMRTEYGDIYYYGAQGLYRTVDIAENVYATWENGQTVGDTSTYSNLTGTSATGGSNSTYLWYKVADYKNNTPILRIVITWRDCTITGSNAEVKIGSGSYADSGTFQIPSDATKTYSNGSSTSVQMYGITVNVRVKDGAAGTISWTCNNTLSYTVTGSVSTFTLIFVQTMNIGFGVYKNDEYQSSTPSFEVTSGTVVSISFDSYYENCYKCISCTFTDSEGDKIEVRYNADYSSWYISNLNINEEIVHGMVYEVSEDSRFDVTIAIKTYKPGGVEPAPES